MKTILLTILIFTLFFDVSAQKKASDKEFEGLKGAVKSVLIEYMTVQDSGGSAPDTKRIKWGEDFFDKDGRHTQTVYSDSKLIYSEIDGFKTFKSYELKKDTNQGIFLRAAPLDKPKPIEEPEKIVPPDIRFDFKYTYEYNSQGRVKIERQYGNNGRLFHKIEFIYDANGLLIEENVNDTVAISKFKYKYDEKGNLIEKLEDRDIKGAGTDRNTRTVYSDYKFDAQGNWTQRKQTWYFEVNEKPLVSATMYYRTIVYYK